MSGWIVLALNIGLVANSVGIVLLARAQSHITTVLLELIETVETKPSPYAVPTADLWDSPTSTLICNDADHHPPRCDCGHGRPS